MKLKKSSTELNLDKVQCPHLAMMLVAGGKSLWSREGAALRCCSESGPAAHFESVKFH